MRTAAELNYKEKGIISEIDSSHHPERELWSMDLLPDKQLN
jgi:hypothetical protein